MTSPSFIWASVALFVLYLSPSILASHFSPLPPDVAHRLHLPRTVIPRADPEIDLIFQRRVSAIIGQITTGASSIPAWLSTLGPDGQWPASEVDLTTGCAARRANWPAQDHWIRISTMSAAWHGGLNGASDSYVKDPALRASISSAIGYWFSRDIIGEDCLDFGNTTKCPCSNPDNTLWNTNWFSNIILIPKLVSQTCLMLNDTLTDAELAKCSVISTRSYKTFNRQINGVSGGLTGANALDVARIGMNNAILVGDVATLSEAIKRIQVEMVIQNEIQADGIRADGSFAQHAGMIYNGNYGKDFANGIVDLETEIAGTQYASNEDQRSAFGTLFDGGKWMIVRNALTGVLHWDFSVLIRFLVFPTSDAQPTHDISLNLTKIAELGTSWNSKPLKDFSANLVKGTDNANAGKLVGNKMFFTNDYMVHRGSNFVSTLRLWSKRTRATECTNSANTFGFHLGAGVNYNYIRGDEYEDTPGTWDWNLIPGITVDYGNTPLICANTKLNGSEAFVGGVSDGHIGAAAMRFTNPVTKSLKWQKAWFYLPGDVLHVMVAGVSSQSTAPVYSVLDQRRHRDEIYVDDGVVSTSNHTNPRSLWHGDIGYTFPKTNGGASLVVQAGDKPGNWQAIGTSLAPPYTLDMFAAYLVHDANALNTPISYTAFPGTSRSEFKRKSKDLKLRTIKNDVDISAVYDEKHDVAMFVFWNAAGGSASFSQAGGHGQKRRNESGGGGGGGQGDITITVDKNVAVIYDVDSGRIHVSDPSQSVPSVKVVVKNAPGQHKGSTRSFTFNLPQGGLAGQSMSKKL